MDSDEPPAPQPRGRAYLRLHSPPHRRVLEPCVFTEMVPGRWALHFDAPHFAAEVGEERLVYYTAAFDFLVQRVRVESQSSDGPLFVLVVVPSGVATSANTRSEPRVDTAGELEATLGEALRCEVLDLSLSGLGVVSHLAHGVGEHLAIEFESSERTYSGEVEVRGRSALRDGRTRYGLLGVFNTDQGRKLRLGLTRMTVEFQSRRT